MTKRNLRPKWALSSTGDNFWLRCRSVWAFRRLWLCPLVWRSISFNEKTPLEGSNPIYMRHPDSFRLSLLHISHESYALYYVDALMAAHTNMEKIWSSTMAVLMQSHYIRSSSYHRRISVGPFLPFLYRSHFSSCVCSRTGNLCVSLSPTQLHLKQGNLDWALIKRRLLIVT